MESRNISAVRSILSQGTVDADTESGTGAMQAPNEPFRLLDLPPELIVRVIRNVPSLGLGRLERVCKLTQGMAVPAYKHAVGPRPWQREVIDGDYRSLAVAQATLHQALRPDHEEKEELLRWSPAEAIAQLTGNAYLTPDENLIDTAEFALFSLQASPERDSPSWVQAVATALMAQRRATEAASYYAHLRTGEQPLPAQTLLTAARFGWPFEYELPTDVPQEIRNLAFVGAAAAGKVEMLRDLHAQGVNLNVRANLSTAATTAAAYGHVNVLRFLEEHGDNLLAARAYPFEQQLVWDKPPLYHAAVEGHVEAIEFLLGLGARPDVVAPNTLKSSPYFAALEAGNIAVMRLFVQNRPELRTAILPGGELQAAFAFTSDFSFAKQESLLLFFVDELGLNPKATDVKGNAAVHFAAYTGSIRLMQIILDAGADATQLTKTGRSALGIAMQYKHGDLVAWLSKRLPSAAESAAPGDPELASALLLSQRERSIRMLVENYGSKFSGNTDAEIRAQVTARWESLRIDQRLVELWSRSFSSACLRDYRNNVIGTELEEILGLWTETAIRASSTLARAARTEIDRTQLELASVVARALSPAVKEYPWVIEKIAQRALQEISFENIQLLHEYVTSSQGSSFCAGLNAKSAEESRLWIEFCSLTT